MSNVKARDGLHIDDDDWWTLRSDAYSTIMNSDYDEFRVREKGGAAGYTPKKILLPLELML